MKVRCNKIMRADGSLTSEARNQKLTVGNEYTVLGIHGGEPGSIRYRLMGDDQHTPAIHNAEQFDIVSSEISSGWVFQIYPSLAWSLGPAAWAKKGFWEAYFDGDNEAKAIFDEELLAISAQDNAGRS
jgi:hypothetical protein